jgi:hypothetical protein
MIAEQPLTPWILFVVTLALLRYTQRWLERHMIGLFTLAAGQPEVAIIVYYVLMLPGVAVHELSHWLVAGALNVRTTRFTLRPEASEEGVRLGYIETEKPDPLRGTLIGIAPLVSGLAIVLLMANNTLNIPAFADALETADLGVVIPAGKRLLRTPDFWMWLYFMFTIANSMMPSAADRRHWPVIIVGVLVLGVLLAVSGYQETVWSALGGPVTEALGLLAAAFTPLIVLNLLVIALVWAIESLVRWRTDLQVDYHPQAEPEPAPPAGSIRSLLDLPLPVPAPPANAPKTPPGVDAGSLDALPDAPDEYE